MAVAELRNHHEFVSAEGLERELQDQTNSEMGQVLSVLASDGSAHVSIPRSAGFSRREVAAAFQAAFQLIGGVPRLALWANRNPGDFFKLYSKLLPSATLIELEETNRVLVRHAIPRGPLDAVVVDERGQVVDQ